MDMILNIIIVLSIFMVLRSAFMLRKSLKLIDAVYCYKIQCIDEGKPSEVDYDDVKYCTDIQMLLDIRNWSYTALISKEKFEIIEPFIGCFKCFGKPNTPNGMAENGCYDCPFASKCDNKRKEHRNEDC